MSRKPGQGRNGSTMMKPVGVKPAGAKTSQAKAPRKSAAPVANVEHTVSFEDNSHLSSVFGNYDQNLALVEHRLGVEISARGNHVFIRGGEGACEVAEAALVEIYNRIAAGENMSAGDIEGVIRMKDGRPSGSTGKRTAKKVAMNTDKGPSDGDRIVTRRRTISPRSQTQQDYIECLGRADLVFALGPAGTGKTYLAVVHAVSLLEQGKVDRIILSRPAVEAGENLGFLPGDMREKVDPYVRPLYDALYDVMPMDRVERDIETGIIEIAPLAFMRGRTLSNAAIILDEAQNCTSMQMRMFLTRLGENSRMVITGDPSQTDLPSNVSKGLVEAASLLAKVEGVEQVAFTEADVVRHDLVARIVRAYGELDRKTQKHK